jgi:hypothetical protein
MATTITAPAPASQLLYECTDCGERSTERRCEECNLFNRRLGAGGHCPHCDEPVLVTELLEPEQPTTQKTPSHTENLTGSDDPAEGERGVRSPDGRHSVGLRPGL